ncbi:MAG TPA: RHS repeat-associated core domain-containing protein, partial [Cellvibrionaceae bacterium]|nr:RHS repeat-associated core domain-containing protein [Cellvibrionaceae bacterium]
GRGISFERNLQGRINKVYLRRLNTPEQKLLAEYDYSETGDLIAQRNVLGVGERYEYKNHLFTRRILATGFSYYYQWDGEDNTARCLRNWGDDGIYNYRFSWQPQFNQSSATDSNGYTNHYTYNEFGQIIKKIDKEGGVHSWDYRDGLCVRYTDPEGNCTYYNYNEARDLISVTDPLNHSNSIEYTDGLISRSQDKNGAQWSYQHNTIGQLIAVTDPTGQTTHLTYNAQGLLVEERQGNSRVRRYEWSDEAELIRVQHAQGHSQSFKYNGFGQLIQIDVWARSRAHIGTTRYQYNDAGQLTQIIYDNGEKANYSYNANGLVHIIKDRQGRITRFDYDGLSQVVRKTDPEGFTLEYQYDKERNLTALINQNGERYAFAYDGNERLISETGFDGRQQTYQYNKAGHLISSTDGDNIVVNYRRDALGRMLAKSYRLANQDTAMEISRYRYNAAGQLVETYNQNQYLEFSYDTFGRLIREEQTLIDEQNRLIKNSRKVVEFARNQQGALTELRLPGDQLVNYAYDQFEQLESVGFNEKEITRIERDELGREISRQQGQVLSAFEYDPMGRLIKQRAQHKANQTDIIDRRYEYDNAGNLSQVSDGAWQIKYVYDQLNRLKETQGDLAETFVFDPASNLLGPDKNAQIKGNRLLMQADRKFTYDARGNLIHEQRGKGGVIQTAYRYNLANQLIEVNKNNQRIQFAYDPLGRRIYKQDDFGRTDFIWAGDQLAQEIRGGNVKTYIFEPESFKPLAVAQNDAVYHYHLDHLGTPKELTNEQGKIVWKARCKTYGSLALKEVDEVENNLRFQGQYYDLETGLHYNRHRYYDPSIGQFISQDPIGLLGGVNNYQYAPNPTGWVDPLGLSCKEIPENYDFLSGKFIDPIDAAQLNHNLGVDIEELLKSESNNFFLKDKNLIKNAKANYPNSPLSSHIEYHEYLAIMAYTDDFYKGINSALRSGTPGKWEGLASSANSGLNKLGQRPEFAAEGFMTRGMTLDNDMIHKLFPDGGEFSDKAFISSSHDGTKSFPGNVKLTMETITPQAKIGGISVYGDTEAEVLFKTDTKFDVVSKTQMPDGSWQIHIKEKAK